MGMLDAFYSLAANINKVGGRQGGDDTAEGVVGEFLPELKLSMDDDDLIKLTEKWEQKWNSSATKSDWMKQVDDNKDYWKGKQFNRLEGNIERPLVDNMVFEGTETFLPAATRQNPEPLVELRSTEPQTEINLKYADIIRNRLADWADDVKLRLKIKRAGRNWFITLVGVAKMGWDLTNNRPACRIVRAQKLILDPDCINDEDGYNGKYVGEYRKQEASILIQLVEPKCREYIKDLAKKDMGTDIQFIEWWTPEYMCWTLDKKVLLKRKNPHWNYGMGELTTQPDASLSAPSSVSQPAESDTGGGYDLDSASPPAAEPTPDSMAGGVPPAPQEQSVLSPIQMTPTMGLNHLPSPRIPYIFLSVFNLGEKPVDETSLITQVLPQQDLVNKRNKQIDKNADGMNSGMVVSEERSGLNRDEAKQVTDALRKGGTVVIPAGAPREAVDRFPAAPLPSDVYTNLLDNRNRFREILGIKGITPAGVQSDSTVRGKIIVRGLDTDRIGGGITEYFEQFADDIYNYVVQLMYVYDETFQQFQNAKVPKVRVSVKEGSLLPKDATTKANQAIDLATAGQISSLDLFKALEYPDPQEMAVNLWLQVNAPEVLFKDDPRVAQVVAMKQQMAAQLAAAEKKGPSQSISFKDLPPGGKVQQAAQAGIQLQPGEIMADEARQDNAEVEKSTRTAAGSSLLKQVPNE